MKEKKVFTLKGPYIELKTLLKLLDYGGTGGEVKMIVLKGFAKVNGEVEKRRGKKLYPTDVVTIAGDEITISAPEK